MLPTVSRQTEKTLFCQAFSLIFHVHFHHHQYIIYGHHSAVCSQSYFICTSFMFAMTFI